ncbi:uncharacterized protein K489DRAFT_380371 [Dissoconium aciculare CBS 342.82]|uniref:Uncharacterized protein n=1 Tax=Dissoconium aciculare CBS 342.82 TaxID=1314786 RepID=A0A6J3M4M0_9PEZI|nr:uncharacterized protein K489DRAFT_380371 [Dissoconium aciculare CBS 342.82]KAF1822976.1 hypothetical protein K489DRAFT_380371 [Dissoconium aciculare CBS 342.82]
MRPASGSWSGRSDRQGHHASPMTTTEIEDAFSHRHRHRQTPMPPSTTTPLIRRHSSRHPHPVLADLPSM